MREIVIDPITRLEGHGKIIIFINDVGNVDRAYIQIPELRGFEKFAEGRAVEDMPQITARICGVCPMAHHMASTKTLDDLYNCPPTLTARKIRELMYNIFMLEDHALHVYILGGPDFIVGPTSPKEERNILGVINKVGKENVLRVISIRKKLREINLMLGGKTIHPVSGVPGGVSRPIKNNELEKIKQVAEESVEFAKFTMKLFKTLVLSNDQYFNLITSDAYTHRTYYMGLVDEKNQLNFYDGKIRVVDPKGNEFAKFDVHQYLEYVGEHVEPWTYIKFTFLKKIGWKGFIDGEDSGIYSVAPLARLNVSQSLPTHEAQSAFEEMISMIGRPVHHTLANHWARVIEMIYAAERIQELANDPDITDQNIRNIPKDQPSEGMGVVEAPRGTLIHHYITDERGVVKQANLIVATQNNAARIALSIDKAAKQLIRQGQINEGILNMIEMAFRAYDPCHACGTHSLPGNMPLAVYIYDMNGKLLNVVRHNL
ncbi:MAG: Ni/Fe hydrogenase subunit alpha [Nitrososphaerota archaeon]